MSEEINPQTIKGEIEFDITEVTEEYALSKMPITQGMLNPYGTVHAGAILWFADVTATVLTFKRSGKGFPLAVNLYSNLLSNQKDGILSAESRITRSGSRVTVVKTLVTGNNNKLLAEIITTHIQSKD